jgi:hypothetical protein
VTDALDFLVRRHDLRRYEFAHVAEPEPAPGEVVLRIDKFGLSANNVTYAALGEAMHYWDFFPAPDGWGRVPVWGYADVAASRHDAVSVGERVFGYLPMSTHVALQPERATEAGFVDGAPHRAHLPGVYQRYSRVANDEDEDREALWRPLFMTSFGAADFLAEHDLFGGRAVVLSSASSKTALGTAFLLARSRPRDCEVVALTSAANVEFCERVGYYDAVLPYDGLASLSKETPTLYVDFSGNPRLLAELRGHLGETLVKTIVVGATHWEDRDAGSALGSDGAEFFFLPPWIEKRRNDWGPGEFGRRYGDARRAFLPSTRSWLKIVHGRGPTAVEEAYRELLDGRSRPDIGHVLTLTETS